MSKFPAVAVSLETAKNELSLAGYLIEQDDSYLYARQNANGYPSRLRISRNRVSERSMARLIRRMNRKERAGGH